MENNNGESSLTSQVHGIMGYVEVLLGILVVIYRLNIHNDVRGYCCDKRWLEKKIQFSRVYAK